MQDFNMTHGDVNSGVSDERPAMQGGVPKTGFSESPMGECCATEPMTGCTGNKARIK